MSLLTEQSDNFKSLADELLASSKLPQILDGIKISGQDIYEMVIQNGITKLDDFKQQLVLLSR